ncbi:hypothetical protein SODALDRAFT_111591 [Sodiomyces alkalinus F11]|uniref:Uncharacterized protein n=1 Tax=Sodiomyces alkalinus (strain CBS 110278 / VKM F-3762 / F11) TaxID=1314773 RepID=A0A3N2Q380_SODAK|nr:hypothetical protein SODALDRAFT_111591 [Sodiomyces alkalinus F11]ROT41075.1 hypothetical protein SODALDRAFT_111591 [Sodiomyces alkalinus F11]
MWSPKLERQPCRRSFFFRARRFLNLALSSSHSNGKPLTPLLRFSCASSTGPPALSAGGFSSSMSSFAENTTPPGYSVQGASSWKPPICSRVAVIAPSVLTVGSVAARLSDSDPLRPGSDWAVPRFA